MAAASPPASMLLAVAFMVMVAGVAAETHRVSGGPGFDATAWLSGRLFTVGDKIQMEHLGSDEKMVEVGGVEEFETCDVSNPMRMIGEAVALEEEGIRYFTSSDPESCRNGLKLPVDVQRRREFDPDAPSPYKSDVPPYEPDVPYTPRKPDVPPYEPDVPYPPRKPDVPYPPAPSSAATAGFHVLWFLLSFYYLAM